MNLGPTAKAKETGVLTLLGDRYRLCDGMPRRSFLKIGAVAAGGLCLPDVLRAEARAGQTGSHKSVIMVFLPGGPSHIDLVDLKPDAPREVRGEFRPIKTRVPGIEICEHLPHLARIADKLAIIRTVMGGVDEHAVHICLTGYSMAGAQPAGGWPAIGSVVSKLQGAADPGVPPYVGLAAPMLHPPYNDPGPGFLGAGHRAFSLDAEGRGDLVLKSVTPRRLRERRPLLAQFDRLRRDIDASGAMSGMDSYEQRALNILTSSRLRDALDLSREDPRVVDRYGKGDPSLVTGFNAAPRMTEHLLLARRVVEAGARFVTVAFGAYDWHEKNFEGLKQQLPLLDRGIAALVEDLHQRGMANDVSVVVWGEFGRSPRINQAAGRDHWPAVSCALLACGGMKTGQVIGATNRLGEMPKDRPVHFREVTATLYHHLGIDANQITLPDLAGRPQYLIDDHPPIAELI